MGFAAGERVTAGRLNLLQPTTYSAVGTGMITGPATNADVSSTSTAITTVNDNATYKVTAVWDVTLTGSTTSLLTARLNVDGSNVSPLGTYGASVSGNRATITQQYTGTLVSAGSHTFKLVASPVANQTVQGTNTTMVVTISEVV